MCGVDLPEDLPYNQLCVLHSSLVMRKMLTDKNSLEYYGPRYKLEVLPTNAVDHNPPEYLERIK